MGKEERGFTDAEMREMEAGAVETETQETETVATETATATEATALAKGESKPAQTEGKGKPPPGYVPVDAVHEARKEAKEAKERAQKVEALWQRLQAEKAQEAQRQRAAAEAAQIPDRNTDPIGYLEAVNNNLQRQLQQLTGEHQERRVMDQQAAETDAFLNRYATTVRNFTKTTPDYNDAYNFLVEARDAELQAMGFDDPVERSNRIQYEEGYMTRRAFDRGHDPAQMWYNLAKTRGFKAPAPQPPPKEESKIERLQKVEKAARSLNGGKTEQNDGPPTLESMLSLDGDDFDKQWEKWAKGARRTG